MLLFVVGLSRAVADVKCLMTLPKLGVQFRGLASRTKLAGRMSSASDSPPHQTSSTQQLPVSDDLTARRPEPSVPLPHGLFVVDKPPEWTSSNVVMKLRNTLERHYQRAGYKFGGRSHLKVGHGGTLDPLATGLLVIGVGKGCKQLQFYARERKSYIARAQLGRETTTQDSTGDTITTANYGHVTSEALEHAAQALRGEILQRPPIFSALKKNGQRMYDLARAGKIEEKDMQPRPVTIYELQVAKFDAATGEFELHVTCSGGTYIRSLIVDLARGVGSAAHMTALHRTGHGPFSVDANGQALAASARLPKHASQVEVLVIRRVPTTAVRMYAIVPQGKVRPVTVNEFGDPEFLLRAMELTGDVLAKFSNE